MVDDEARRFLTDLKSMQRKKEDHWMAVGFGLASFWMAGMGLLTMHCLTISHACVGSPPSGWLAWAHSPCTASPSATHA